MNPENSSNNIAEQKAIAENEILRNENMDQDRVDAIMGQFSKRATEAAVKLTTEGNDILSELTVTDTEAESTDVLQTEAAYNAEDITRLQDVAASQDWSQERYESAKAELTKK